MAQPFVPGNVEALIEGRNGDRIAVSGYTVQFHAVHGGVVNRAPPAAEPYRPRPRPTPVLVRPRPFPDLLDREAEVGAATSALRSAQPAEFYGRPGLGKTALLRYLAHRLPESAFPDGMIYLSVGHQHLADLLQSLFEHLYESDADVKPTNAEIRQALQRKRALILLDDVELVQNEVEALMNAAPGCTFLLASPERRLWGEGRAVALGGLPPDAALALVERELGRPLTPEERPSAESLCTGLEGHPWRILQAAAMVGAEGRPLAEVVRWVQSSRLAGGLAAQVMKSLPKAQQQVLAALAAVGDAPLRAEHLAAIVGGAAAPALQALQSRGLVETRSPRYGLTGDLGETLRQAWDLTPWAERALAYFTSWAERRRTAPDRLLEEADPILRTLEWAAETGRWAEVLRLGRAVEGALALGRRWGAWARVLRWMLEAARALGKRAAEGWALHQLGTRALCLDRAEQARSALSRALRIREVLGDRAGAEVTRHNLNLIGGAPLPPRREPRPPSPAPETPLLLKAAITLVCVLILTVGGGVVWLIWPRPTPPPPPPSTEVTQEPTEPVSRPWVGIRLDDGCDREYGVGDQTTLVVEANVEGAVQIWLDQGALTEMSLTPGEKRTAPWTFGEEGPGGHRFRAVLMGPDGEELDEESCSYTVSEEEELDSTGPPAPTPLKPKDGAEISCSTDPTGLALRWTGVEDPSGIAGYYIELEAVVYETPMGPTPTPADIGPVSGAEYETSLDCGWNYRWRVRAVDGAGNAGEWSDRSSFSIYSPEPAAVYDMYVRRMDFSDNLVVGETIELFIMIATDVYPSGGPYFPASRFRWRQGPGFAWQEEYCPANTQYAQCSQTVEFSYSSAGEYYVEVEADSWNEVSETDEYNNVSGWTVKVLPMLY